MKEMITRKIISLLMIIVIAACAVACGAGNAPGAGSDAGIKSSTAADKKVVVVSPHPVEFMKPLLNEFETETGITVEIIKSGTSEAVERIRDGEAIDVLWGGSVLSVGSYEDLFAEYRTVNRKAFADDFKNMPDTMTCFTDVPSVLIVNTDLVGDIEINGYEDLLNPRLNGKIAFANPARSSSSFEHLTNMLYAMGDGDPENGWDYAEQFASRLKGNFVGSSSEVYKGVAGGKYIVGLTFEEAAVTMLKSGKHVKIVYMEEGVVSTPDGLYINKNAPDRDNAEAFVDFMTAVDTQNFITKELGRRSVRIDVPESELVAPKKEVNIIKVDPDRVKNNKDKWVEKFVALVEEDGHE